QTHPPYHAPYIYHTEPPTAEHYTLSLHDALPISAQAIKPAGFSQPRFNSSEGLAARTPFTGESRAAKGSAFDLAISAGTSGFVRSEEHTSELQSRENLVCRLLLEKKNRT